MKATFGHDAVSRRKAAETRKRRLAEIAKLASRSPLSVEELCADAARRAFYGESIHLTEQEWRELRDETRELWIRVSGAVILIMSAR